MGKILTSFVGERQPINQETHTDHPYGISHKESETIIKNDPDMFVSLLKPTKNECERLKIQEQSSLLSLKESLSSTVAYVFLQEVSSSFTLHTIPKFPENNSRWPLRQHCIHPVSYEVRSLSLFSVSFIVTVIRRGLSECLSSFTLTDSTLFTTSMRSHQSPQ